MLEVGTTYTRREAVGVDALAIRFELKKCTDRELRIVIQDQDKHSIPNLIVKLVAGKPGVTFAGYTIEHPMVSYPEVVIMTDGSRSPIDVLREVVAEAKFIAEEFLKAFDKALQNAPKERDKDAPSR